MPNNNWFKLALVSFVGIIISVFALGLLSTMNSGMGSMNGSTMQNTMPMGMGGMSGASMNMGTMPMGNTGMQMPMGGSPMMPSLVPQTSSEAMLLQQIYVMRQEINSLRQMIDQMNAGGMGGSGGGSMGGMSMM